MVEKFRWSSNFKTKRQRHKHSQLITKVPVCLTDVQFMGWILFLVIANPSLINAYENNWVIEKEHKKLKLNNQNTFIAKNVQYTRILSDK